MTVYTRNSETCIKPSGNTKSHESQERNIGKKRMFWAGHPCGHLARNFRQALHILEKIRAARVQNEFAPEKFLNRYEKRFEKREKGPEKRSETRLKIV